MKNRLKGFTHFINQHKFICVILLACLFKQVIWVAFIPIWQFPDEQAHFAQVQNYAEGNPINPVRGKTTSREVYESEILLGTNRDWAGNNNFTYHPEYKIAYSNSQMGLHEDRIKQFPQMYRTQMVIAEATAYPPLYYRIVQIGYQLVYKADLLTRIFTVRMLNIVFFLGLVVTVYKMGNILFPKNSLLQYSLTSLVAFHPMLSYVSAGVNSDALYNLFFAISLYVSLFVLNKSWNRNIFLVFVCTILVAPWVKPQAILILFVYIFPVLFTIFSFGRKKHIGWGILLFIALLLPLLPTLYKLINNQQFIPDIAAFSQLPALGVWDFLIYLKSTIIQMYRQVLPWYWGVYRWLSFTYPRIIYRFINLSILIAFFGVARYIFSVVQKRIVIPKISAFGFLLYASFIYFLGLTVFNYLFTRSNIFSLGIQGRYFFPIIAAHMTLLLIGWFNLSIANSVRNFVLKVGMLAMILLHFFAQFWVILSYHSVSSLAQLFLELSQYKPWFFKSPMLEIIGLAMMISQIVYVRYLLSLKYDAS